VPCSLRSAYTDTRPVAAGENMLFDSANMKVTNLPEANQYLGREYRKGWELTGLGA